MMAVNNLVIGISAAAVISVLAAVYIYRRRSTPKHHVGYVKKIELFPIKACLPISVNEAECTPSGLVYKHLQDRMFVIVYKNQEGRRHGFVGVSNYPKLTQVKTSCDEVNGRLKISAPGMDDYSLSVENIPFDERKVFNVGWFDKTTVTFLASDEGASDWFTKYIGEEVRVGYQHPNLQRLVNKDLEYNTERAVHPDTKLNFQNSSPFSICTTPSIEETINMVTDANITDQFPRANITVSGDSLTAFDEDHWRDIYIGGKTVLWNSRECPRCPTIQADYSTGELRANKEPYTTLMKHRRGQRKQISSKPVFGLNLSLLQAGRIKVGDQVIVTRVK